MRKYDGREQTLAKHEILRRYLEPFAMKVLSKWESLDFIDGFSGPWENKDKQKLSDTSIGIALEVLSAVAERRGTKQSTPTIRCIFNEKNRTAYGRLVSFVKEARDRYPLIDIRTFHGSFEDNAPDIRAAAKSAFQLLFIDPTGYSGFPPHVLKPFCGRSSEIIVNFMRPFIDRFIVGHHEDRDTRLVGLLGEARARELSRAPFGIANVEAAYLEMLRSDLGYKYAALSPIHDPDKSEINFNLVFGTHHADGMEVMRQAEYKALSQHDRTIYERRRDQTIDDLFEVFGDQIEVRGPYLTLRQNHQENASATFEHTLRKHGKPVPFPDFAARMQELFYLRRSDIGDILCDLANRGVIEPTWEHRLLSSGKFEKGRKPRKSDRIKLR